MDQIHYLRPTKFKLKNLLCEKNDAQIATLNFADDKYILTFAAELCLGSV